MKRLLVRFPGESNWREEGIIYNSKTQHNRDRIRELEDRGYETKLECLRNEDHLH